jgi:hypothetical protein
MYCNRSLCAGDPVARQNDLPVSIAASLKTTKAFLLVLCLFFAASVHAQTPAPLLFFSDLDSGPATGGEGATDGAYVCAFGEGFGGTRGSSTISIGGVAATNYPVWSDPGSPYKPGHYAKACAQVKAGSTSSGIQMTTPAGTSGTLPFTVRPGNIYFVSTPADLIAKKNAMVPGDIVYANSMTLTTAENFNIVLWLNSSGSAGSPNAIVAYPGATVLVDGSAIFTDATHTGIGIRDYRSDGAQVGYWTIAGLTFNANSTAVELGTMSGSNFRLVGNEVRCTGAYCDAPAGYGGMLIIASNTTVLGNWLHDIGCSGPNATHCASGQPGPSKLYHTAYYGGSYSGTLGANHSEFGWNEIDGDGGACRGLLLHTTFGPPLYDFRIHDNAIHDTRCDGINLGSINPSLGAVEVWNNLVWNAGKGPNPYDGVTAYYTCLLNENYNDGVNAAGQFPYTPGSGTASAFNNTFVNCGGNFSAEPLLSGAVASSAPNPAPGTWSPGTVTLSLMNNIIRQTGTVPYRPSISALQYMTGNHNDCFGSSATLQPFCTVNTDPGFVNPAANDYHLQSISALIGSGATVSVAPTPFLDTDGVTRPTAPSLGAYEKSTQSSEAITWPAPAAITYGTALSSTQLNASSSVPGTFVYAPAVGTVLSAGTSFLTVTFTPTDTVTYSTARASVVQVVQRASTATTLSLTPSLQRIGQPVTLAAMVTSVGGAATGSVVFKAGTTVLGSAPVSGGLATLIKSFATTTTITAQYLGDGNDLSSTSAPATEQIVPRFATTTTLSSSLTPAVYGNYVTLLVRVTGPSVPTGSVLFRNSGALLGSAALDANGVAVLTTNNLPAGTLALTASYSGSATLAPSTASLSESVHQATSTLTLLSSLNPSAAGQPVEFIATVNTNTSIAAVGTVTFSSGATMLGTGTLAGGRVIFITNALPSGANSITATYGGNTNIASSSATLTQQVN